MKTRILFLFTVLFLASLNLDAQEITSLEFSKEGFKPVVIKIDSLKAEEIYQKGKDWVFETYKNPNIVLMSDVKPEKLRVNSIFKSAYSFKTLGMRSTYDVEYLFDIEIKDYKIRVSINIVSVFFSTGKNSFPYKEYFKENGELRSSYKDVKPTIEDSFSTLVNSLTKAMLTKKADW